MNCLSDLNDTPALATLLTFTENSGNCDKEDSKTLTIQGLDQIRGLYFKPNSFQNTDTLIIDGLNNVEVIEVASRALPNVMRIDVSDESLGSLRKLDLQPLTKLRKFIVGEYSMTSARAVDMDGLSLLDLVQVNRGSFMRGEL